MNSLARIATVFRSSEETGPPSARRLRATLAILALSLVALLASAGSASATSMGTITNVTYTSAHLNGQVSASGPVTTWAFEYSTNETTWSSSPVESIYNGNGEVTVKTDLTGLKGTTKYFVRLAVNGVPAAPAAPPYREFTTPTVEPATILATNDASAIFSTTAAVAGKVKRPGNSDPAFDISGCRFEVVSDADFVTTGFNKGAIAEGCEPTVPYKEPNGEIAVTAHLTGLSPSTTYHLRLAVENAAPGVVTKEAAHTFTTAAKVAVPIILATNAPNELKVSGGEVFAKFSGEVQRPLGEDPALDVNCHFEFVTEAKFNANAPGERFAGAEQSALRTKPDHQIQRQCRRQTPGQRRSVRVRIQTWNHLPPAPRSRKHQWRRGQRSSQTPSPRAPPGCRFSPSIQPPPATPWLKSRARSIPEGGDASNGNFMEWGFQYSTEPGNPNSWNYSSASGYFYSTEETPIPVSGTITGLKPGTKYYLRLFRQQLSRYLSCLQAEPYVEFTTKGTSTPPSATLDPVSGHHRPQRPFLRIRQHQRAGRPSER